MARVKVNISLTEGTKRRLQEYAREHHVTISKAIEQWIWSEKVNGESLASLFDKR